MDVEDRDIIKAELDASPEKLDSYSRSQTGEGRQHERPSTEEIERRSSHASSSCASSAHVPRRPGYMLRTTSTQVERDLFEYLDRHPTAIQRIQDHRLQHSYTVGSTRARPAKDLPDFGGGKPYPPDLPDREEYVVEFNCFDDAAHPQEWSMRTKVGISIILVFNSFTATLASAIYAPASMAIQSEFGVGQEVATLGTSLFVLGYGLGPITWAPMSELYGRRLPTVLAAFMFGIFMIASAVAKDLQTFMIARFWAGFSGSAALTMCPAVFADMYSNRVRGLALAAFSATVFNGPLLGPLIGGFMTRNPSLGWRWTQYLPAIFGFASAALALIFQKESYGPVILVSKAAALRRLTRNWGIHAKQEEVEVDFHELIIKNVGRPLRILFTEPIVLLVTIYMAFLYGLLYLSLTAYGIVFNGIHGFPLGIAGLPYVGMMVGVTLGLLVTIAMNGSYVRKLQNNNNVPVPEWRLYQPMAGGIIFAIGLFWFGWTGYTDTIPWIVPTLAGLALGFGIFSVFLHLLNYIIDSYLMFAASAVAANTFLRSIFGAVFPMFATYMFDGIGVNWGMTFLGCLATLLIPMPFIFYIYGKRIRVKSKFAPAADLQQHHRRDEESRGESDGSVEKKGN